jgi:outer membrane protein assembly factor BamA
MYVCRTSFSLQALARCLWPGLFWLLGWGAALNAQTDTSVAWIHIDKIILEGNRKSRPSTILRELKLQTGDSIPAPALTEVLERNRLLLLNLGIFTEAVFSVQEGAEPGKIILKIKVTEAWFVYPVPILALSDRNFNVWWNEFDRSLKRLNYGLDWSQLNLTGRADVLKVKAQIGFTNR